MGAPGVPWTDDEIQLLRKMASEGCPADEIAIALGTKTRNAVIGKAHRSLDIKIGIVRGRPKHQSPPAVEKAVDQIAEAPAEVLAIVRGEKEPVRVHEPEPTPIDPPEEADPEDMGSLELLVVPEPPEPEISDCGRHTSAETHQAAATTGARPALGRAHHVLLTDATFGQCRWVVDGIVDGPKTLFCGQPVLLGTSWCEEHAHRVFTSWKERRSARYIGGNV